MQAAYRIAAVLAPILPDFIQHQIQRDLSQGTILEPKRQSRAIAEECEQFAEVFIASMPKFLRSPREMAANPLTSTNCAEPLFCRKQLNLWAVEYRNGDALVNLSPYAISPESDLGVKITGVDAIILPADTLQTGNNQLFRGFRPMVEQPSNNSNNHGTTEG